MTLVSLIALVYIAVLAKKVLVPFFFSFLFALMLLPIASFLERRLRLSRPLAALLSLFVLVLFLLGISYFIGAEVSSLVRDWPLLQKQFQTSLNDLQNWVAIHLHVDIEKQRGYINDTSSKIFSSVPSVLASTLLSVSSVLLFFTLAILFTFFLLLYRKLMLRFLIDVFPRRSSDVIGDIVENIQTIIRQYLLGLLLEMFVVAAICCISLLLFRVQYAVLFALITALFNVVPYVGIFTSMALSAFITFAVGGHGKVLAVVLTIFGTHLIDSNILLPFIVGARIRLNGMITVLAVIAGEMIWGIPGMFLAVPFTAITKIIFDRIDSLKPWGNLLGHEKG
jgi:predicted PurR-regulated permease PerM